MMVDQTVDIYKYLIINRQGSLSLNNNRAWHIKNNLDIKLLKKGAKLFEGTHDFSTFRASSCSAKSPIKRMNSVKVKKNGEQIVIIFKSKSFLQNQVRSMVGSLKYLSSGKWTYKDFKKAFESKYGTEEQLQKQLRERIEEWNAIVGIF